MRGADAYLVYLALFVAGVTERISECQAGGAVV